MSAFQLSQKKQVPISSPAQESGFINLNNRLRLTEEKTMNLNRKIELIESNMLTSSKKTSSNIKTMDTELLELKRELDTLKQKFELVIKELKMTAGREELSTLQRYIDLWNPARFATREEVERIVEEKMAEKR